MVSILFRVLLISWSVIALPASVLFLYAASRVWLVGIVGLPLLLAGGSSLVLALMPRTPSIFPMMSAMASAGSVLSVIGFAAISFIAYAFGYAVLLLPALASGGIDGPGDILSGLVMALMPGGVAMVVFLLFPLVCVPVIGSR